MVIGVLRPSNTYGHIGTVINLRSHGNLCTAFPLECQGADTNTQYPSQLQYSDIEVANHCPVQVMQSAKLSSDKYKYGNFLV